MDSSQTSSIPCDLASWGEWFRQKYLLEGELKGPGHAILGNFSTDQIVIELT